MVEFEGNNSLFVETGQRMAGWEPNQAAGVERRTLRKFLIASPGIHRTSGTLQPLRSCDSKTTKEEERLLIMRSQGYDVF